MAGLIPPTAGRVVLEDRPVMGPRADIGMMFQQATLLPWKTTLENVVLPIEIRRGRASARAAMARARELLELVGLGKATEAYPGELSGGMAQRAAICRMLITDPAVLLLDESGDPLRQDLRDAGQPGAHRRSDRHRPAAPAYPRHDQHRTIRRNRGPYPREARQ